MIPSSERWNGKSLSYCPLCERFYDSELEDCRESPHCELRGDGDE